MENLLRKGVREAVRSLYGAELEDDHLQIQKTRKEFAGDLTLVVFPLTRVSRKPPEETAREIGEFLLSNINAVSGFNVIKGFLNVTVSPEEWARKLFLISEVSDYGFTADSDSSETIVIEYSSPNTNKPLHLGHIRNNLLGYSLSRICGAAGNRVIRTNIVNDRGIHICKSMVAWQLFGEGATPESAAKKGDHFVGDYYVLFDRKHREQASELEAGGATPEEARDNAPLMLAARDMLIRWEAGDAETVKMWHMMNSWVYEGFDVTYKALGVEFDKIYYESDTYKLGKEIVLQALQEGHLIRKDDGSVWIDLTADKLDHKLLLRSDGTAVYMTQDLGTAVIRYNDYHFDRHIYVVGNEQNYHFQVLAIALLRMGFEWAGGLHHFSYGMVELPEGKMKSREGKVVDADDLITEMTDTARAMSQELGKLGGFSETEKENIYRQIGLAALKY
nr:arginine--tRNA ligase [Bacteroidales bacterium]